MADTLSASFVRTTKQIGKWPDGGNLYLQVSSSTCKGKSKSITKSWLFRYSRFGKDTWLGLGPYPDVSLAEARDLATNERRKKREGIDPLTDKQARRRQQRKDHDNMLTFAECATKYVDSQSAAWTNPKHIAQWRSTLERIAGPVFGRLPVDQVDTTLVLRCLEPIWTTKTETANRLRGRVECVLDWATVRGYRQGENPARWRGHLDKLLPRPSTVAKVRHHAALPYADVGTFMKKLRADNATAAKALEFTILTAARTGESINAKWSEIDFDTFVWTVPAERMKAKREHRVPLSGAAVACLRSVQGRDDTWAFPGQKKNAPLSNMAMLELLKRIGRRDITVHGFRSTFRDWCSEATSYPRDVAEMALAHTIKSKSEAAYRRGDLLEKRLRLMDEWAKYCSKPLSPSAITPIRAAR